ncbi:MAG TPA: bifunctional [glutamine synthetase] adenylyltransferase/[glutamine synthetase]-adenylyl-L-tyrosine phosphorylase, partial [Stellaceae bacterium]|nr:bifunctional [glutamine synthetase] adenylyltransferase/[glutamine synthetase]-adenylyl-L-tyrosine phosphorylase [Stellaceae bacterium]
MTRAPVKKRPKRARNDAALIHRLAGTLPSGSKSSAARVSAWLVSLKANAAAKSLRKLIDDSPALARVLGGIAEAAPYLWDLVQGDPFRFVRLLESDPDVALAGLLATTQSAVAAAHSSDEVMRLLRRMKTEAALSIALCDIGGVWPVERVTAALTDVAETALDAAVHYLLREAVKAKKLIAPDVRKVEAASGYIVLAMGKMGGRELNFSSDIDLMVFFDAAAAKLAPGVEPMPFYVRLTRDVVKLLQERTADGYVFRVDLRLRPDPSSTQIAISTEAALHYYEGRGQNWERAALIKARACAGDRAAGEKLLHDLSPFIWRKYLDYATIADVHEMKRQIHAYRGHGEIAVEGHNIKLGRGGIREIEFFVQTQQLIAGGRHGELRGRSTVAMLSVLAADGWIDAAARDELGAAYDFLRRVEHRLQMMADEQTHTLPADAGALDIFARFLGFRSRDAFAAVLLTHLRKVEAHYVRLFERAPEYLAEQQNLSFDGAEDNAETLDRLALMGFRQPAEVAGAVRKWRAGLYRALRGEQARSNLTELIPSIIDQFARAENPDAAFAAFDRFLSGLRAGGRFLSLLRQNPELIRFVALILGVAPRLAGILAQNPHIVDPLVDPSFFGTLPDEAELETALARALEDTQGYEAVLDAIRQFGQEHMFLIGARILSGSVSAEQAGEIFATLADALLRAVHKLVEDDFALTHGRIRGGRSAIVALGRLGAREMTASSDLDLIVIYDFDQEHPNSDGKRPLYGAQYFARFTQRLISALTVQTNYGVLYQVDMR